MVNADFEAMLASDPEVQKILSDELDRQRTTIQLIASENFTSTAVLAATASVLTNKYSEGYPGRRYYGGNTFADEVEDLARERAKQLFGAEHANVQPHAGAPANLAAYLALVEAGDTILAMRLDQGGHLTHGSPVSITGKTYRFVAYGVTPANDDGSGERIDFDQVRDLAKREQPRLIVAGTTAYTRIIDPLPFREIADEVGARFMFDAAHPAGLIAGGVHPSPVGVADVVTFTTHKTLRGPRGGAILCGEELAKGIDGAVFPGLQGGPLEHVIAAKAVAFAEALRPEFSEYAQRVVLNAKALADSLAAEGFRLVAGGTENHQVILDLRSFDEDLNGKLAQEALDRAGITCNRNTIPDDPRSAFITSGLRLGSAAETTAGMGTAEMAAIGSLIGRVLRSPADDSTISAVRAEVRELCLAFDPYPGGPAL
jgi:glycine hydroxymethyltransferase